MPTFRFDARFLGTSGLSEDVFLNSLYYDITASDGMYETVADGIIAAYTAWGEHADVNGAEVRVYALSGGQPVYSKAYPDYDFLGEGGPHEVAICLSYATSEDWETTTARRRGRIFLGPLQAPDVGYERPIPTFMAEVLDLGEALADVGGADATWMLYSRTDGVAAPIEVVSVDNSWDTQRRRGVAPTQRLTRDVATPA